MKTESPVGTHPGPTGFLHINDSMLVVDFGKIYLDGTPIGQLHEDGLLTGTAAPLGRWDGLRAIEELPGCRFQGIDSRGDPLVIPGESPGPTGGLTYNGIFFHVINGRISTEKHKLIGRMEDSGTIFLRDFKNPGTLRKVDETTQLDTLFQGIRSNGKPMQTEYRRPLYKPGRTYVENEIIRYFEDWDKINETQKRYVSDSLRIWATSGILELVRKREKAGAALGNVKHGASGVTSVLRGMVTLDKEEFETEIKLFKQFGAIASARKMSNYHEIRLNMVVAHEFGHQLEFWLSQATKDRIKDHYLEKRKECDRLHPLPPELENGPELLTAQQIPRRVFISGYSRTTVHEYWAEAVGAFSCKESRLQLQDLDPVIHQVLYNVVTKPEEYMSLDVQDQIADLQTGLYHAGVYDMNTILDE